MEQKTLLKQKEELQTQLKIINDQLDAQYKENPLYMQRTQLQEEMIRIEEQLEDSENKEFVLFCKYLEELGYIDEMCYIYYKDFGNYFICIDVKDYKISVYSESFEYVIWLTNCVSIEEMKEYLSTLSVDKYYANLTIQYPYFVVNGENTISMTSEILDLMDQQEVDITDLKKYVIDVELKNNE